MPARRGRPKKGDRRIDAAIDHFAAMGYNARDIRAVVAELLEVIFDQGLTSFFPASSVGLWRRRRIRVSCFSADRSGFCDWEFEIRFCLVS